MDILVHSKPPVPVVPEVESVTITLTQREAQMLLHLCGRIGGSGGRGNPDSLCIVSVTGTSLYPYSGKFGGSEIRNEVTDRIYCQLKGKV